MAKSLEGSLTKKAHKQETYDLSQQEEMAKCMDPVTGPLYFMSNYYYIQHPTRGRILYRPYEYQKRVIEALNEYISTIVLQPRQSGKCFRGRVEVNIRCTKTGEVRTITASELYEMQKVKHGGTDSN